MKSKKLTRAEDFISIPEQLQPLKHSCKKQNCNFCPCSYHCPCSAPLYKSQDLFGNKGMGYKCNTLLCKKDLFGMGKGKAMHLRCKKKICVLLLKSFQVKEYVTFSKLVPKELFLVQSIQNPCKTHYTIVRPLINCSRHSITMACFLNRLPVYPDISNKKVRYSRNRIRKQVIPSLQFFFNPEVEKALFKFSELQAS